MIISYVTEGNEDNDDDDDDDDDGVRLNVL